MTPECECVTKGSKPCIQWDARQGKLTGITPAHISGWSQQFPDIDVPKIIKRLEAWILRTGLKPRDAEAFVFRSLKTDQDDLPNCRARNTSRSPYKIGGLRAKHQHK